MRDVDRKAVGAEVALRLLDAEFRSRLTARAADGSHPLVIAMTDDRLGDVLAEVGTAGGAANIVTPWAGVGLAVVGVRRSSEAAAPSDAEQLTADCTYGVFLARLINDGAEMTYCVVGSADGVGCADLTGVSV